MAKTKYVKQKKKAKRKMSTVERQWKAQPLGGFPANRWGKFRYVETITLDPGANGYAQYNFLCNGIVDPNSTGAGHQPAGSDEIRTQYDRFQVMKSVLKAEWLPYGSGSLIPGTLVTTISENGTDISTAFGINGADAVMEQNRLSHNSRSIGIDASDVGSKPIYNTFNSKKFFGKTGLIGGSTLVGDSAADPTELAYYEVVYMTNGGNDPGLIRVRVTIDYLVYFTERAYQSLS